jgi:hypothetical protein
MKYSEVEPWIKTGDVLTCQGTWLISRGIQLLTRETVSHVGIAVWVHLNGKAKHLCMFEAMEGRDVGIVPLRETLEKNLWKAGGRMWWSKINDPAISGYNVMDFCIKNWGAEYANKYQFIVGMSRLIRYLRTKMGKSLDTDPDRWHCSELVTRAFMEQGYKHDKEPALTTPGDVSRFACLSTPIELTRD